MPGGSQPPPEQTQSNPGRGLAHVDGVAGGRDGVGAGAAGGGGAMLLIMPGGSQPPP